MAKRYRPQVEIALTRIGLNQLGASVFFLMFNALHK
jgi:hypothetical protein